MKPKPSAFAIPVSVLLLTLLLVAATSAQVSDQHQQQQHRWHLDRYVELTEGGPPFVLTMQFSSDGNFITTETDEFAVTQGVWQRVDPHTFALTTYGYDFAALRAAI